MRVQTGDWTKRSTNYISYCLSENGFHSLREGDPFLWIAFCGFSLFVSFILSSLSYILFPPWCLSRVVSAARPCFSEPDYIVRTRFEVYNTGKKTHIVAVFTYSDVWVQEIWHKCLYHGIKSEHNRNYVPQINRSSGNTAGNQVAYLPLHKFVVQAWL